MQFLAATWAIYGVDANGDGRADRWNPADAIFAAARYLKANGAPAETQRAIFAYNHSQAYVETVLRWASPTNTKPRARRRGTRSGRRRRRRRSRSRSHSSACPTCGAGRDPAALTAAASSKPPTAPPASSFPAPRRNNSTPGPPARPARRSSPATSCSSAPAPATSPTSGSSSARRDGRRAPHGDRRAHRVVPHDDRRRVGRRRLPRRDAARWARWRRMTFWPASTAGQDPRPVRGRRAAGRRGWVCSASPRWGSSASRGHARPPSPPGTPVCRATSPRWTPATSPRYGGSSVLLRARRTRPPGRAWAGRTRRRSSRAHTRSPRATTPGRSD